MLRQILFMIALLSGFTGAAGASETIGRLFHTPEERAALDQLRRSGVSGAPVASTDAVRLDGVVKRGYGKSTAWINGAPQHESDNPHGILVRDKSLHPAAARVALPTGQVVDLKAGQAYNRESGAVQDVIGQPSVPKP